MKKYLLILLIVVTSGIYLWNSSNAFQEIPYDYDTGKYEQPVDNDYKVKEYAFYINKIIYPVLTNYNPDKKFIETVEHLHKKMQWEYNTIFPNDRAYYKDFKQSLMLKMIVSLIQLPEKRTVDEDFYDLVQGLSDLGGDDIIDDAYFYSFRTLEKHGAFNDPNIVDLFIDCILKSSEKSDYDYHMSDYIIEDVAKHNSMKYTPEKVQALLH